MNLLLATHNPNKAEEFQSMLADLGVGVLTLEAFPSIGPIEESAATLEGNALLKAEAVFLATGLPSLADDTGLEVHYLNGAPGVLSARYSGAGATYAENVSLLLRNLRGVPERRRASRFRCVLAFIAPGVPRLTEEGICRGRILEEPRGEGGFGYDPVFLPVDETDSFAEMSPVRKNALSHRGRAIGRMLPHLRDYFARQR